MRKRPLRRWLLLTLVLLIITLGSLVLLQSQHDMTLRQRLLKFAYPALMWVTRLVDKNSDIITHSAQTPPVSFYGLSAVSIEGKPVDWTLLRGKKVLLVNTASDCGYTAQYATLQTLQDRFADRLVVIGFPANDFKEQEQGDNASIASFCQRNYGVRFLLMQKTSVVPGTQQDPIYRWLTDPAQNGWNSKAPSWNFSKYLVDEQGRLTHYFDPSVSPLDESIIQALQ